MQENSLEALLPFNKQHDGFFARNPAFVSALVQTIFPVVKGRETEVDMQQHWLRNRLSLKSELLGNCEIAVAPGRTVLDSSPVGQTVKKIIISNNNTHKREK